MSWLDDSLFVSSEVVSRDVKMPDGKMHPLYFRELSAVEFRRFQLEEQSPDEDRRAAAIARIIHKSLANEDGSLAITLERSMQLKPAPANAIVQAILDVNSMLVRPGEMGNASSARSGSGTPSPSPLED